jgi:hypothetical protein
VLEESFEGTLKRNIERGVGRVTDEGGNSEELIVTYAALWAVFSDGSHGLNSGWYIIALVLESLKLEKKLIVFLIY